MYNRLLQSFIMDMPETVHFSWLIQLKFIDTLFELVSHENTDIAVCVLQILLDMSDTEDLMNHELIAEQFFDSLVIMIILIMMILIMMILIMIILIMIILMIMMILIMIIIKIMIMIIIKDDNKNNDDNDNNKR